MGKGNLLLKKPNLFGSSILTFGCLTKKFRKDEVKQKEKKTYFEDLLIMKIHFLL